MTFAERLNQRIEEWHTQWNLGLVLRPWIPSLKRDEQKPSIGRSLRNLVVNYVAAYVFGMFLLILTLDDGWWGHPFNSFSDDSHLRIVQLVSICFVTFVALNFIGLLVSGFISWLVYWLLGSEESLRTHCASILDLTFIEFIAAMAIVSLPGVMGNRPDFWNNEWAFNVSILIFLVTRIWYLVVAWYEMRALHEPTQNYYDIAYALGFFPVFVAINVICVGWLWLRLAEHTVMTYR